MGLEILSDDSIRILTEVTNGTSPAKKDTKAMATFRKEVAAEVAEIRAAGQIVEIPFEMPEF